MLHSSGGPPYDSDSYKIPVSPALYGSSVLQPDTAGLQVAPDPRGGGGLEYNGFEATTQKYYVASVFQASTITSGKVYHPYQPPQATARPGTFRKKRRRYLIGLAVLACLLIAILGGVLGRQAQKAGPATAAVDTTNLPIPSNSSNSSTLAAPGFGGRVRSRSGAWNGTGITTSYIANSIVKDTIRCGCWFQDHLGNIQSVIYDYNDTTGNISYLQSAPLPVTAANGTSLASHFWLGGSQSTLQLIYVSPDGILSDLYQVTPPFGPIQNGNLSNLHIKVPLDSRPTLYLIGEVGEATATIFVGTVDQQVHAYLYDHIRRLWYPRPISNFSDSWAYGGAAAVNIQTGTDSGPSRILFLSDRQGSVRGYLQRNTNSTTGSDNSSWSVGDPWGTPIISDQKTLPNTSLALNLSSLYSIGADQQTSLLFATTEERFGSRVLNTNWGELPYGSFGAYNSTMETYKLMQGSDIGYMSLSSNNHSLIIYQDEATSLAWMVMDATGAKPPNTGHFTSNATGRWFPA